MKKLNLILVLAISVFFISCEVDNEEVTQEEETSLAITAANLTGTWEVTDYLIEDGVSTTSSNGESVVIDYTATAKDYDMTISFSDDPNTITSNGSFTMVVTSTLLGQEYTQEETATTAFDSSEWEIDGDELFLISEEREDNVTLTELTETKMVMVVDLNEEIAYTESTNVTATGKLTLTLER